MGKKFMRRLLVLLAAMCLMITMAVPVYNGCAGIGRRRWRVVDSDRDNGRSG